MCTRPNLAYKTLKCIFSLLAPKHFLLFKVVNTKQDLKSSLMTQGRHYGKQLHNDVISQGLLR